MKIKNNSIRPKIIWIGPYIPIKNTTNWTSASPAASKWQKHILESLFQENIDIKWVYYRPDSYWPKGRLLPSKEHLSSDIKFNNSQIHYLNFFGLRNFTTQFFLERILEKIICKSTNFEPLILISYNSPKWINNIFLNKKILKRFFQIYLLADDPVLNSADGYIFLSFYSFKKYKLTNKLHLDGAIYPNIKNYNLKKNSKKNHKTIFFYSGSMHKWGGVKLLIETMKYIKRNDFELWISGPGDSKFVQNAAKIDNRIKFLGLLTDYQLKNLYQKTDVFLNPRPIKMPGNEFNFPSKLFDYLAWNKPIISTFTKSLSPEYKNILHIIKDNPKAFAKAMIMFIIKKKIKQKIDPLFLKNKSWKNQAQRLIFFINKIIKKKIKNK